MAWEAGDVLPPTGGIYGRVDTISRVASQIFKVEFVVVGTTS